MSIEKGDIQAVILRGYPKLRAARFYMLAVESAEAARAWLGRAVEQVVPFEERAQQQALHLAFTHSGLANLGMPAETLDSFSREFREGMTAPHRRRSLGDHGISDPSKWSWGGGEQGDGDQQRIDILLMLYAKESETLADLEVLLDLQQLDRHGLRSVAELGSEALPDNKEHFGFRDGISQPAIRELSTDGSLVDKHRVRIGEFVLGYKNEYGQFPHSPILPTHFPESKGLTVSLSHHPTRTDCLDFGRNGSYMVFRQIEQDVAAFWRYINTAADLVRHPQADADGELTRHWLAAKMVGRWMEGEPMTECPLAPLELDDPRKEAMSRANDFAFHDNDQQGYGCPLGSHIRRSNPRDSLDPEPGSDKSWDVNRRHRIIRRGRTFGKPLVDDFSLPGLLGAEGDGHSRGLHFICFNANIVRQFEFIQQSWVNSKKFADLYNDADPLIGDHDPREEGTEGQFTIQESPLRQRVTGLGETGAAQFTRILGGAYFFMPGIKSLQLIASIVD